MPKVSVIVPAYNCEAYIEECIRSITGQSERDLEIIAVDDGSTDATLAILKELARADTRLSVYSRANSGYAGVARNFGLARSTGSYIAFIDADDVYHPDRIKKALAVFDEFPETDIVFHDHKRFRTRPQEDESTSFLQQTNFLGRAAAYRSEVKGSTYLYRRNFYNFASIEFAPFHTSSIMMPRQVLSDGPPWFREDIHPGEDGDLWLRITKNRRVAFLNEVLSYYRERPGSVMGDRVRYLHTSVEIHQANLKRGLDLFSVPEIRRYRRKIAQQLFELGYEYFSRGRISDSRHAYRRSLQVEFRPSTLVAYSKSFMPQPVVRTMRAWRSHL